MEKKHINPEKVRKLFSYCPSTGIIKFNERPREDFNSLRAYKSWNSQNAGRVTGFVTETGSKNSKKYYLKAYMGCIRYYVHRLIWVYMTGQQPDEIDHIDGNEQNNVWSNLRSVPHRTNGKNQRLHNTNTSGSSGVTYRKDSMRWRARIMVNDKQINLGSFINKNDAINARIKAEQEYW